MDLERAHDVFTASDSTPFPFQVRTWEAYARGESGLVHAPTGMGKTLAACVGPLLEPPGGLRLLWITPLRALASDTLEAIRRAASSIAPEWTIEPRTGETSQALKRRQRDRLPEALVTTPESATILLSYPDLHDRFRDLRCIVVDEWHELLGTKRGVQTELAIARCRSLAPEVRVWGLSATIANLDEAARVLAPDPTIIRGEHDKRIDVETLLPEKIETFPWAGHIGTRLVRDVIDRIERARTTLVFTNTRSQAEIWFNTILRTKPDLIGAVALHHASLSKKIRTDIEAFLRMDDSPLRAVVCTSSLDLGVDFRPVDQVIQIGSPKGIARLVQRAGRSGHAPGEDSVVVGVPTNAFEIIEFRAAREAIEAREIEPREPVRKALDVLAQHVVTVALAAPFDEASLLAEIRSTHAYRDLTDDEWTWVLAFAAEGGSALTHYDRFRRLRKAHGRWSIEPKLEREHRMSIGTIVGDPAIFVKYANGRTLGTIEESFIARLHKGEHFVFAGRVLELVRLREMTATVRRAASKRGIVPRWNGGRFPLSTQLASRVRARLANPDDSPEMRAIAPLLERQRAQSIIPEPDELLVEQIRTKRGWHVFLFPFAGRLAHEGMGSLLGLRLARLEPRAVRSVVTDYGIELASEDPLTVDESTLRDLLSTNGLVEDLLESLNLGELARRQFRVIARIAGLTRESFPGQRLRHVQASSDMFYDVLQEFDQDNMLLEQARREVLESQLEIDRVRASLESTSSMRIRIVEPAELTPFAFPLYAESLRATTVSTESWEDRVRKLGGHLASMA